MPGNETGGVSNFWYSFDYGNAHFVSMDGETDFPYSPEYPFVRDVTGNETLPTENQTFVTDSGPFGMKFMCHNYALRHALTSLFRLHQRQLEGHELIPTARLAG